MKKITQVKSLLGSLIPLLIVAIFLNCTVTKAQNTVYFQDEIITMPTNIASFNWNLMPESAKFNGGYFGWARFSQTPTQAIQDQFAERNLKLIEYFPDKTYLFYFPASTQVSYLQQSGVISIIPIENDFKKSAQIKLNNIDSYAMQGNKVLVMLEHYDFISTDYVTTELLKNSTVAIKQDYKGSSILQIAVPYGQIDAVVSQPFVKWVELVAAPAVKEDTRGRSLHRAANLDTQTPTGRNYTGVGIGVMVRDDGVVGPHIDFQGRIDNSATSTTAQTHGDGVAGIMTGAGNLDPTKRGMAAGADVYVVQYAGTFLDPATTTLINDGSVQITNSSYGDGCNGGYTSISRTVDTQTNDNPSLLHVFSAGNSGTSDCGYGAGAGWGNITGGHKQGKNVIATANTFFNGARASSSSRGPAADGRIKPDITAHGQNQESTAENNTYQTFGGTSGAAPGIAGVSAQLYEAYAGLNGGTFPESALIKATLLNTANDYGNVGPDYSFGWGMVNGLRAAMLIEDGRYLNSTVAQGANNNHSITVPANTTQVRFMVYWSDAPAAPGASPALVNDLDLVVTDPGSTTYQPWVLNTIPNATLLNLPATTGVDRLNNVEQVLINNPAAGTYNINIAGFNVPMGPQKYYVVYEIITDGITLTYPQGGQKFVAGTQEVIHWDAINAVNSHVLEYSTDNGTSWNSMATLPPGNTNYTWNVPGGITSGECLIRITNGTLTDQSANNFSIASRVTGVNITQVCPMDATVTWNAVAGATSYDVYLLGDKFMEIVGNSTTTSLAIPIPDPFTPIWVAVTAKGGNGWETLRSNAIRHLGSGLFNCPLSKDLSVATINNSATDFQTICNTDPIIVSVDLQNDGTDPQSNFAVSYQIGTNAIVQEMYTATIASGATDTFNFATPVTLAANGDNTLRVWTSLAGDEFTNNDEKTLDFYAQVNGTAIDFTEDFENGALPEGWSLDNPDNGRTWQARANVVGIDGNSTSTTFVDGANYTTRGQEDTFTTEYFDLNFNGTAELTFDLAKAQWSAAYNDALRVEVSIDCGITYTQVYFKDGTNLATIPYTNSSWAPNSAANWRTEIIDLTPFVGENILARFININDYSNSTFIDNIILTKTLSVGENALEKAVSMYPNPAKSNVAVIINTTVGNTYEIELLNSLGQSISKIEETRFSARAQQNLDVSKYGAGLYFVKIKVGDQVVTKKLIVN